MNFALEFCLNLWYYTYKPEHSLVAALTAVMIDQEGVICKNESRPPLGVIPVRSAVFLSACYTQEIGEGR